jgi:hypothetical protein
MELAPIHGDFTENNLLQTKKSAGISKETPASLGETPEGGASFASQK